MRRYVVEYRRGTGGIPWAVYRIVPKSLIPSGRVWLIGFETKAEAEAWAAMQEARAPQHDAHCHARMVFRDTGSTRAVQ